MKLGMIGVGKIGRLTAPTLAAMEEISCYAVASRDLQKVQAFAEKYGFQKAYGSYEELIRDPEVELIYVATPHSHHYEHIMMALDRGKSVICEKAFTMNARQAKAIREAAREKGLYVAEAIWTRYMPSREIIDNILARGIIGIPSIMTANLSYSMGSIPRLLDPNLCGGALLDVGVYGLNFMLMHFGHEIERIESSVRMTDTGVDGQETITVFYKDSRMAVLTHGIFCRSDRQGIISGDKGYIVVENINNPQCICVYDEEDRLLERHPVPEQLSGYEYEFREAVRCIREGRTESISMPLDETVRVMELMDSIRAQWGLVYPREKE